jgi:uracil-DNA glycosylase
MIYTATVTHPDDMDEFRSVARRLLAAQADPADVSWSSDLAGSLFHETLPTNEKSVSVPRSFASLSSVVICHRDEQRWSLMYEALWRLDHGERALMQRASDPLLHRLHRMAAAVKHDQHRMTAFVRFRAVADPDGDHFIAWYEPRHHTLRRASAFFIDRFANMRFSILTPDLTLHWNRNVAQFTPGLRREDACSKDAVEDWWRRYYAAIFNPARTNAQLMQRHMPRHFWRDLPEATIIVSLIAEAGLRTDRMIQSPP